jgi:hypothetical protein
MSTPAWTRASVNALQPSSAHFTRLGIRDPGEGDAVADLVLVPWVGAPARQHAAHGFEGASASSTLRPMTSSARIEAEAVEIEQPSAS